MQINVSNISVEYDGTPVIYQADFVIHENEKIALIGRNGCGKTTLLKVLTGEVEYQKGEDDAPYGIFTSGNPVIGFLKQTSNDDKAKTMFDEILDAYSSLIKIEKDMESALEDLQKDSCDQNVRRYSRLCEQFERGRIYLQKRVSYGGEEVWIFKRRHAKTALRVLGRTAHKNLTFETFAFKTRRFAFGRAYQPLGFGGYRVA